ADAPPAPESRASGGPRSPRAGARGDRGWCTGRRTPAESGTLRNGERRLRRERRCGVCSERPPRRAARSRRRPLGLLALDALEQRAEVAFTEPEIALALDDFVEERPRLGVAV